MECIVCSEPCMFLAVMMEVCPGSVRDVVNNRWYSANQIREA